MTTTPSISIFPSERRMASTARPSALFLSPRPIPRALARAPASVTPTSSSARLRLISADTLSVAGSGRAIKQLPGLDPEFSEGRSGCYACDVPAWHARDYFSWADHRREKRGNREPAAGEGSRLASREADPGRPCGAPDLPDLPTDARVFSADCDRPLRRPGEHGRRRADRARLRRRPLRGLSSLSSHPATARRQHYVRRPHDRRAGGGLRPLHRPGRASRAHARRPEGPAPR